ncbi:MAG: 30S ribosome-binding factor RbfA [Egibacteraceae bacterium]
MSTRLQRVNAQIQELLAEFVPTLKDPRIGFVTITAVRTSTDLGHAEVFYTVLPDDPDAREATASGLHSAAGVLRREVGERLRVRRVPNLHFTHDPAPERGRRIEGLLRDAQRQQSPHEEPDAKP